jgi:thioredoxin reductase (NADPH)
VLLRKPCSAQVIIIGGGLAGLSAAIYLGRAQRETLLIDDGHSMARWEPVVQNYLGFPDGIGGPELLKRGQAQARAYGVRFARDHILTARTNKNCFRLRGEKCFYACERLLLATGIFHIPPDIPGVKPCLGHSMFFCKDCDGVRVHGKTVAIYGYTNEAVEYALGLLLYTHRVVLLTDGHKVRWDDQHAHWLTEYEVPICHEPIVNVDHKKSQLTALIMRDGSRVHADALFTTRGDIYYNKLAKGLGAEILPEGEIQVNGDMCTTVPGLYAAGCVTPANCQMIIAAGEGATAAQAINRDLFEESLATHTLQRYRRKQLRSGGTRARVSGHRHGITRVQPVKTIAATRRPRHSGP